MRLYLVQHGLAKSEEEDPERPLSDKGAFESERVAAHLASRGIKVQRIFHSSKLRARETARIFARHLKAENAVLERDGLAPKDDPAIWKARLDAEEDDILLVGHLPHQAMLASSLLCGESDRDIIRFRNSGVVCLDRGDNRSWSVSWMLVPHLVEDTGCFPDGKGI
jgi:phosphohistidine phosphatase